ncbi:MAG: hypothetical protein IPO91_31330 [Chloroflexi bacterium]|nr:hypothetical protein [Chloroflexota bacterium]
MKRIVVLVSGSGTNLQALIDARAALGVEIALVVSNRAAAYALERAKAHRSRPCISRSKGMPARAV